MGEREKRRRDKRRKGFLERNPGGAKAFEQSMRRGAGGDMPDAVLDMFKLSEDDRIAFMAKELNTKGNLFFFTDKGGEHEGKMDRYLAKLKELVPAMVVADRFDGPVEGAESVKVRLPTPEDN
jgi:hypothetical protein